MSSFGLPLAVISLLLPLHQVLPTVHRTNSVPMFGKELSFLAGGLGGHHLVFVQPSLHTDFNLLKRWLKRFG